MNNLPAKQNANTIQKLFDNPKIKSRLQKAIPQHLTVDRLLRVAITAIRANPKLMECTQESILSCVMGCAKLGLEPEPFLGQAYMVPYYNGRKKCFEAQLIPGYRGYISLARRSGELRSLSVQCVYKNDHFKLGFGLTETLEHVPAEGDRGDVKGAYCIFRYKDGSHSFDYMPKADIDKIRERSKAGDSGPWKTDYPEMCKKTVIRRHIKVAPLSIELAKACFAENLAMGGESQIDFFAGGNEPELITDKSVTNDTHITAVKEDAIKKFKKRSASDFSTVLPYVEQFVKETADTQDCDPDEVRVSAVENWEIFSKAFSLWMEKRAKPVKKDNVKSTHDNKEFRDDAPPSSIDDEFYNRFKNMKKAGYKPFLGVEKHQQRIIEGPGWLQEKAVEKWKTLYPDEPFPIDVPEAKNENDEFALIVQTDEWQELSVLQQQHPGIYKKVVTKTPKTMAELNNAIETICSMAAAGDEDGMPTE